MSEHEDTSIRSHVRRYVAATYDILARLDPSLAANARCCAVWAQLSLFVDEKPTPAEEAAMQAFFEEAILPIAVEVVAERRAQRKVN